MRSHQSKVYAVGALVLRNLELLVCVWLQGRAAPPPPQAIPFSQGMADTFPTQEPDP